MSKALFLQDSYLKESDAEVVSVKDGKYVVLDQTIFYPKGGGQPWDTGKMIYGSDVYNVIYVGKFGGKISHELDKPGLISGEKVHCVLNWERRYRLMRNHTAAHTLAAILVKKTGALITGNQLEEDKVRFDFSLEDFDREIFKGSGGLLAPQRHQAIPGPDPGGRLTRSGNHQRPEMGNSCSSKWMGR